MDFALARGGSITGTVTTSGEPLSGISIGIFDVHGESVLPHAQTDGFGRYTFIGLPSGTYCCLRTFYAATYTDQVYNGIKCLSGCPGVTTGAGVGVEAGQTTSGIDFDLTSFRRYFAEGAATGFFDCVFALLNPNETSNANVVLRFLRFDGERFTASMTIPPLTRMTLSAKDVPGLAPAFGFSTIVESNVEIVVDRTMKWDGAQRYGSHAETAIAEPARTWYLAEGATHSGFDLYYMIQNPSADPIDVKVTYLRRSPNPPIKRIYSGIAPLSRTTIYVNDEPGLAWSDVSGVVTSLSTDHPIIVERAMYLDGQGVFFEGGTASAGTTAPATDWFLAEGATLNLFDLYVTLANPGDTPGTATLTYMLTDGRTVVKSYPVGANSRQTVWVNGEQGDGISLSNVSLSTVVHADVPIIVERSMWWPMGGPAQWREGHNAVGTTSAGSVWALADGEQGGPQNTQTYILVANTSPFARAGPRQAASEKARRGRRPR